MAWERYMKAGIFSSKAILLILSTACSAPNCTGAYNRAPVRDEEKTIPVLYLGPEAMSPEEVSSPVEWDVELCKVKDNAILDHPVGLSSEVLQILNRERISYSRVMVRYGSLVFGDKTIAGVSCILISDLD